MNSLNESSVRDQAAKDGITHLSTGVAVVRAGKILIVRRAVADFLGGQYELPGGGVDDGETITEAAIREVQEETGLTVSKILSMFGGFDYTTDRKPHVRQFNFLVEVQDGEVTLNPEEHDEYRWVDESDYTDVPASDNMRRCFESALHTAHSRHLYLITLEVDPLVVGQVYDPLPSHLTLVSRFWSDSQPDAIAEAIRPILAKTDPVDLVFGDEAVIGPKQTVVHLVENTPELKNLHMKLVDKLNTLNVTFTSPQYVGEGHKPHVSKRPDVHFEAARVTVAANAYLIEVEIQGKKQLRNICAKFGLGGQAQG